MNKRAQLTLMIITGIILLFAIGLVIWLSSEAAQRRTAPEAEQQRLRQLAVQPVKDYIQSCLDITTATGLELLGKQGGVLYQSQGGLTKDVRPEEEGVRFIVWDGLNVSYVIRRPEQDIGTLYFSNPPEYPYSTFPYLFKDNDPKTNEVIQMQYSAYFGDSKFPPLFKPGKESIQEQLESYANNNLPRCTKWETFKAQGLEITASEPNTSVFIAENLTQIATEQFFTVLVNWQVTIKDLATQGETTIAHFSLSYPVHLAKLYLFIQSMMINEISNSTFDPRNVSTQATPVLILKGVYVNPIDQSKDDLVIVQDAQSVLRGKPLEFRLLRQNRIPALVWSNQTDLNKYHFCKGAHIKLADDALTIMQGDPSDWSTHLVAYDPDEDFITFYTKPPASSAQVDATPPELYHLYVYATDSSEDETTQDYQILEIQPKICIAES